jgi:hypothetical protein
VVEDRQYVADVWRAPEPELLQEGAAATEMVQRGAAGRVSERRRHPGFGVGPPTATVVYGIVVWSFLMDLLSALDQERRWPARPAVADT